jgi:hypothetical protein
MTTPQSIVIKQDLEQNIIFARTLFEAEFQQAYVIDQLKKKSLPDEEINFIVDQALKKSSGPQNRKAQKDIIVGGIFFGLGIILTAANIGYIFWGAIVFGGIQMFRGIINAGR